MLILGKPISDRIARELTVSLLGGARKPVLALVVIGSHPVIDGFVRAKKRFGEALGIPLQHIVLPEDVTQSHVLEVVDRLANDQDVDGIVVQLPIPSGLDLEEILSHIPLMKDVDVLKPESFSYFVNRQMPVVPPVVGAVDEVLQECNFSYKQKHAVVLGQGRLVGAPVAAWLRMQGAVVDVGTKEAQVDSEILKKADLVISGVGSPHFLTPERVSRHSILIDAGTSESAGRIAGDVDPRTHEVVYAATPVPGGIGPITVAVLFRNLLLLAENTRNRF